MSRTLTTTQRARIQPPSPMATEVITSEHPIGVVDTEVTNPSEGDFSLSSVYETRTSVGHKGPPYKDGGPFKVTRVSFIRGTFGTTKMDTLGVNNDYGSRTTYVSSGRFSAKYFYGSTYDQMPRIVNQDDLTLLHDSYISSLALSDLNDYGADAIKRFSPLNPGANAGQFIAEILADGRPSIPDIKNLIKNAKRFRELGKEYLNVQFGWVPFLKDLRSMYHTWNSINSRMAQIIRDNNKPIRRSGVILHDRSSSVEELPLNGGSVYLNPDFGNKNPGTSWSTENAKIVKTINTSQKVWFAGRFRYFIPDVTDDRWTAQAKFALFGLNPTPALLYEVMPWSWLLDWFTNLGEVISNLSSNGIADLILDYGYLMRHTQRVTTWEAQACQYDLNTSIDGVNVTVPFFPPRLTSRLTEEVKERVVATPFGFGLQVADLSARQLAILAALGLSRQNFI